jgi:hypothetical protein
MFNNVLLGVKHLANFSIEKKSSLICLLLYMLLTCISLLSHNVNRSLKSFNFSLPLVVKSNKNSSNESGKFYTFIRTTKHAGAVAEGL